MSRSIVDAARCTIPVLLFACSSPDVGNLGVGNHPDAGAADGARSVDGVRSVDGAQSDAESSTLAGKVCALLDPRVLDQCATAGLAGLTVTLDGSNATTSDDGSFAIARPTSTMPVWQVSGTGYVTSLVGFGGEATLPVMPAALYDKMGSDSDIALAAGSGSIVAHLVSAGAPVQGALVTPDGVCAGSGADSTTWTNTLTGAYGVAWIANQPPGEVTVSSGSASAYVGVVADAIAFVTIDVGP